MKNLLSCFKTQYQVVLCQDQQNKNHGTLWSDYGWSSCFRFGWHMLSAVLINSNVRRSKNLMGMRNDWKLEKGVAVNRSCQLCQYVLDGPGEERMDLSVTGRVSCVNICQTVLGKREWIFLYRLAKDPDHSPSLEVRFRPVMKTLLKYMGPRVEETVTQFERRHWHWHQVKNYVISKLSSH